MPNFSFAYDAETTHPGITEQTIEFYNLNNELKISSADKELIIQGSIAEDVDGRPLNHFYEPQREMGINNYRHAVQWVTEPNNGNEFTWAKSIAKYAKGDREEALIGLGHVLHLVADMTVPDHTRNDPHIGSEGVAGIANTGDSPYEEWAKENKTRDSMWGTALYYKSLGYRTRYAGSNIEDYFKNISAYSNGNYVSPDTINNSLNSYIYPEVIEKRDNYAYGKDYFFYDRHKIYIDIITSNGEMVKTLVYKKTTRNDFSVLEEYFNRLVKMAILSGAGITEMFIMEGENARAAYLEAEVKKQAEAAAFEAERLTKQTEGGIFSQLWYRLNYAVTDTASAAVSAVLNTVSGFGYTIYSGASLAVNNVTNVINGVTYTGDRLAAIGTQKVEQGVQTARMAVVSTTQKVILYVRENTSDLSGLISPAVVYNPQAPVLETVQVAELISILSELNNIAEDVDTDNSEQLEQEKDSTHHSGYSDPLPAIIEIEATIATSTEQVLVPTVISAEDITNTTPFTTILFSGTSTPDFIITTDFSSISTSTDSFGNWSLLIENISEGTTTLNFFTEPDILHASTTYFDPSTNVTTVINYEKSDPAEITVFVIPAPSVNISVLAPAQCADSFLVDRCLITSDELEMSWSSDSLDLNYYTIIINDDLDDTSTTTEISGILDLYDETENTIEIFATDNTGLESDHIIYEVIVYRQPISVEPDWRSDYFSAINSKIILYNNTPYNLDLENWSLSTLVGSFALNLTGVIQASGEYILIKDSGSGAVITGANQTYTNTLTRTNEIIYLKRFLETISSCFLGVAPAPM
jgi:hypothetical protein